MQLCLTSHRVNVIIHPIPPTHEKGLLNLKESLLRYGDRHFQSPKIQALNGISYPPTVSAMPAPPHALFSLASRSFKTSLPSRKPTLTSQDWIRSP
jgi:hypothetical protein